MVDASLGEIMTTCEKINWLLSEGEKWLKPEYRYLLQSIFVLNSVFPHLHLDHETVVVLYIYFFILSRYTIPPLPPNSQYT